MCIETILRLEQKSFHKCDCKKKAFHFVTFAHEKKFYLSRNMI